jgi:hypothetical protein
MMVCVGGVGCVGDVECVGDVGGRGREFDSHQLNETVLFFFLSIFSSFIQSYFIFHVFKNAVPMNSIYSVRRIFHRTEVVSSDPAIF